MQASHRPNYGVNYGVRSCILHWPIVGGEAFRGGLREAARTASSEVPLTARRMALETLDALRERDRAQWFARAYRDHGDTMRRIADEADLPYSSLDRIIEAWEARANARCKT